MTQYPAADLKLWSEVKEFLNNKNDELSTQKAGCHNSKTFSSFQFPMEPNKPYDEVFPHLFLGNA